MNPQHYALLFALLPLPAAAADTDTRALEELVVTGERVVEPQAVGRHDLDADSLFRARLSSSDTAKLLLSVPGVHASSAGGVSSLPSVHGLADDRLRIRVDGMDLIASCPNHMNPALSYIAPAQVETLSVFAGIAPVSTGGDSIGAAIIADSASPVFATASGERLFQGEAGGSYRSNGDARTANLAMTLASENLSLSYNGVLSESDNYTAGGNFRDTIETGRQGHTLPRDEVGSTAWKTRDHMVGLAVKKDRHQLQATYGYQDMPYQLYPNQRMDLLDNQQRRLNLRYKADFDSVQVEAGGYRETVNHRMDFGPDRRYWYGSNSGMGTPCTPVRFSGDPDGTCAAGMPMNTESETLGFTLRTDFRLRDDGVLRIGTEYQTYELDDWWPASGGGMGPGTFWNIRDGERDRVAFFGEWESRIGSRWVTSLGVRYENVKSDAGDAAGYSSAVNAPGFQYRGSTSFNALEHDRNDDNWNAAALARYVATETFELEFGYAHKVRSPNLYERYTWSTWPMAASMNNFVGDGNGYVGNPALEPEQADTFSVSLDWHSADRSRQLRLTPFYTRVHDYIDAVAGPSFADDAFNILYYTNESARIYGFDLSARLPIVRTRAGEFGLEAVVNYTDGENRDSGDDLYNIMPLNVKLSLTHQSGRWDNAIELIVVASKDKVSDVRNEIETPGYELVNMHLGYAWANVRLGISVENLLDENYALPLGGAYTGQGMTMSLNGIPWGIPVPGMGRSVNAGIMFSF
ncbi:MAG: TonB-dependent receptor [Pseudomonadales bacterium]